MREGRKIRRMRVHPNFMSSSSSSTNSTIDFRMRGGMKPTSMFTNDTNPNNKKEGPDMATRSLRREDGREDGVMMDLRRRCGCSLVGMKGRSETWRLTEEEEEQRDMTGFRKEKDKIDHQGLNSHISGLLFVVDW